VEESSAPDGLVLVGENGFLAPVETHPVIPNMLVAIPSDINIRHMELAFLFS
jgi:hypothetical protein